VNTLALVMMPAIPIPVIPISNWDSETRK